MFATRARRRLLFLAVLGGAVAAVGWYRSRAIARNAEEFHARYG